MELAHCYYYHIPLAKKKSHMAKTSIDGVGKIIRTGRHCKSDSDGWGSVILHKSERLETKLFFVFPCEETGIASQKLPKLRGLIL